MNEPRVVLITGGTRGIGLACARAFAAGGDRVAVASRSASSDEFFGVTCDVAEPAQVAEAFGKIEAELGPVQVLVSNAGITRDTLLARMSEDDFTSVLDANLTGAYRVAKRALPAMMKARFGRMIFVSSVSAYTGQAGQANYAASKSGLIGFARSIAREYATRGITANVVTPGPIATDMTAAMGQAGVDKLTAAVPMQRIGTPDEVAAAVRFLASNDASFITGTVLPVDGGLGMGF